MTEERIMFLKKYLQLATLAAVLTVVVACLGCVALDPYGRPVIVDPMAPVVCVPRVYVAPPPPVYYYYAPPVYYVPGPYYYGYRHHHHRR